MIFPDVIIREQIRCDWLNMEILISAMNDVLKQNHDLNHFKYVIILNFKRMSIIMPQIDGAHSSFVFH